MKKLGMRVLLVIMMLCMCFTSVACGGDDIGGETDSEGNSIIKIMFHVDKSSAEGMAYQKRIDAFNVANKEAKIKATPTFKARSTSATGYETELLNMQMDGTLPDIITFDAPNAASYAKSKILYDITNTVSTEVKSDFYEISKNYYNGGLYGLPIQESSAGIFYNKNIFGRAGVNVSNITVDNSWTFTQFKDICEQLKAHCELVIDLRLDATKDETATYLLYPFIYAAGGTFLSNDGMTATDYMNSTKTANGFQFIQDIYKSGYTSYSPEATGFFTGKYAMYLSSGWTIPDLDNKYPDIFPDRNSWGLLPYPKSEKSASATGSWSFGITNNSRKDKTNVSKLLEWMVSSESSKAITDATGMIPARKSLFSDSSENKVTYIEGSPEYVLFRQMQTTGITRPVTTGYPQFSSTFAKVINGMYDKTLSAATILNTQTPLLQSELDKLSR